MRITSTIYNNGSFGFGFGIWRAKYYSDTIIYTIAIGPICFYLFYKVETK